MSIFLRIAKMLENRVFIMCSVSRKNRPTGFHYLEKIDLLKFRSSKKSTYSFSGPRKNRPTVFHYLGKFGVLKFRFSIFLGYGFLGARKIWHTVLISSKNLAYGFDTLKHNRGIVKHSGGAWRASNLIC